MRLTNLSHIAAILAAVNFWAFGMRADVFSNLQARFVPRSPGCSQPNELLPTAEGLVGLMADSEPAAHIQLKPTYNCFEECTLTDTGSQEWCENTGDCDDGWPWHYNDDWERVKYTFECYNQGTHVKCLSWQDSGCCGSADLSAPLCIESGEKYCNQSFP